MSKRWTIIFKALGNINRLRIIQLLAKGKTLTVSQIADELGISLKATSKHLIILQNLDVLDATGKLGHVFYSLSVQVPKDIKKVCNLFT